MGDSSSIPPPCSLGLPLTAATSFGLLSPNPESLLNPKLGVSILFNPKLGVSIYKPEAKTYSPNLPDLNCLRGAVGTGGCMVSLHLLNTLGGPPPPCNSGIIGI